ncbi:MAG: alpha-L-fucosidase [Candidatus Methylacidiphilales bacterium]
MTIDRTAWFDEARYGMFIHWGAYAVAGRGEWAPNRERIPFDEYKTKYADNWHAENYDPAAWAALAVEAGMKYAVLTTRHHDGLALWPTATSDFHTGNIGPKRDLVGPYVEAFRAAGLKVGLYFSPAAWYHPDYPGPWFRDWPAPQDWKSTEARERFIAYWRAQIRELMTSYGKIDYLWYDGVIPSDMQCPEANEEAMQLQPHLIINERNGQPWHVKNSEQAIHAPAPGITWEACMTLNDNWGYHPGDFHWKDSRSVVEMLLKTANKAGNLLLNVGPAPDGTIPEDSARILREAGKWLERNGESIRGSELSPYSWTNWGTVTVRGSRIYLHISNATGTELCVTDIANKVLSAKFLHGGESIAFEQNGDRLFLRGLPEKLPDPLVTTLVLEVEGIPSSTAEQTSFWIPG